MTEKNVCLHWQAPGLPFDSDMPGAVAAFHDGRDYALELLAYVVTVQGLQGYTVEQQANMARAALCGFADDGRHVRSRIVTLLTTAPSRKHISQPRTTAGPSVRPGSRQPADCPSACGIGPGQRAGPVALPLRSATVSCLP